MNGKKLNSQGVAFFNQGNYSASKATLQQALSHDPRNPHIYYNLARVHHESGKARADEAELQQARNYYEQCLRYDGDHEQCYRGLAVLMAETNQSEQAFTLLEDWAARSPHLAAPKIELARLYEEFNEPDAAKENLVGALAREPNNARALAALGKIREMQGDYSQALADYQRSLKNDPDQMAVAARVTALQAAGTRPNLPLDAPKQSRTASMGPAVFR